MEALNSLDSNHKQKAKDILNQIAEGGDYIYDADLDDDNSKIYFLKRVFIINYFVKMNVLRLNFTSKPRTVEFNSKLVKCSFIAYKNRKKI